MIYIVDAVTLVYLKSMESDMSAFRQGHYCLTLFYKFFPMMSSCSRYFTTLSGQRGTNADGRVTSCVSVHTFPVLAVHASLRRRCRQVIRTAVRRDADVECLPLPRVLKQYLVYS